MKSYTDLPQSKKLAEFLPIESADMSWVSNGLGKPFARKIPIKGDPEELCGCWSLAALLEELPDEITTDDGIDYNLGFYKDGLQYYISYRDFNFEQEGIETDCYDDFVDACYEMILKLHEQKIL